MNVHLVQVGIFLFVLCCEYVMYLDSVLRVSPRNVTTCENNIALVFEIGFE
jgi:hypothetical protein